ncbi:MAG TPA: hypothetical protein VJV23_16885 [Candidatus Polarisedimenticolia bacterium]|nr:hypothetical protein [Candidatus Polarisedimenticolia bacterium]
MRGSSLIAALALPALAWGAARAEAERPPYEGWVVGLNITWQTWDEDQPWLKRKPETRRAGGVVVGENLVLTTAEMLEHATFVQLETHGRSRPGKPQIKRVDRSANLALLSIEGGLPAGLAPAPVAPRTPTSGTLRTVRWRGQQIEAAASRVIRLEVERSETGNAQYAHVRLRTDLSGGGWSEPVFDRGALVGLTVSQDGDESRAIPAEILSLFVQGPAEGAADSLPALGAHWQVNKEEAVTKYLGQEGAPRGILIRQVPWGSTGCGVLQPRDILLELDGEAIDAEGFFLHPWLGRIGFHQILSERFKPGDEVRARVHRGGRELDVVLAARAYPDDLKLIPGRQHEPPPFLVAGGLVIRELDVPYLRTWGKEWNLDAPDRLYSRYYFDSEGQRPVLRRVVLVTAVLPSVYTIGYHHLRDVVIERFNGRPVSRLEDVAEALESPAGAFHVIDLARESAMDQIVLDAGTLKAATGAVMEEYGLPSDRRMRSSPLPAGGGECQPEP